MKTTRRNFLRLGGAASGATAFNIAASDLFGARAPGSRISVGLIGLGGRGLVDLDALLGFEDVAVRAVCDANRDKASAARARVDRHTGRRGCVAEVDYRALCGRADIDAVVIATPDHSHAAIGIEAARAGKDIYGEPPFTHTLGEGRLLADEVARRGRVWQTGSWQRSHGLFRAAASVVRSGGIGPLARVEVGLPGGGRGPGGGRPRATQPSALDWEAWLGASGARPFAGVCDYHWRWVSAWGGGSLAEWIGHHGDVALWGAGRAAEGPLRVEGAGQFPSDGIYDTATSFAFSCRYVGGLELTVADGGRSEKGTGVRWIGAGGEWVWVTRGAADASRPELRAEIARACQGEELSSHGPALARHLRDFLACVRTRRETLAPAEAGHRAATLGHLGERAMREGRALRFDPHAESVS